MTAHASIRPRLAPIAPWVSTVVRLGLGGVLVAAGGLKIVDPQSSVRAVAAYEILPSGAATVVGWGLPFAEVALGLLLILGAFTRVVASISAGLLVVFIAAVISAAVRGLSIDCGCFGGGGQMAPGQTHYAAEVARDVGFLAMAVWLVWRPRSHLALEPSDPPGAAA